MKTDTVQDRLAVYKEALAIFKRGTHPDLPFTCLIFSELGISTESTTIELPEWAKYEPENLPEFGSWFPTNDTAPRIRILKLCIKVCERKIQKDLAGKK